MIVMFATVLLTTIYTCSIGSPVFELWLWRMAALCESGAV